MATSNSSSSGSDANQYAAIDRITHDAENTPHQHQPIQNEIANAVANAELVDGVLGPAHQEAGPNYRQIISEYAQRICERISGALQRVPDPVLGMALGIAAAYGVRWLLGEWPRLI